MITCDRCKYKFDPGVEPGALVFSPPDEYEPWLVTKRHLCSNCWLSLEEWLFAKLEKCPSCDGRGGFYIPDFDDSSKADTFEKCGICKGARFKQ